MLRRLDELARHGADAGGGVTRIAFSPAEAEANALVTGWMEGAGLTVARDAFGNLFGSTDGNAAGARPVLAGSHLDTVPSGGRLDGALGTVAAIAAIEAMLAVGGAPALPAEVVVWRCEEPVRFAHGKVGSLLFSGQVARDELAPLDEDFDLGAALAADPSWPARHPERGVGGCLELHIEQGRRLERAGRQLGVVTAVASPIRLRAALRGRADHSGATPMDDRRDALAAAAELILAVERAGRAEAHADSVATCADVRCHPAAMNVVPGSAEVLIDVRGIDGPSMGRIVASVEAALAALGAERGIETELQVLSEAEPTPFDAAVIAALVGVAQALGHEPLVMPSGAGHDAQCLAPMAPAGMFFVPSVGGVSHSPDEHTDDDDLVLGARALAAAWTMLREGAR
jgi:N-carbamoyl-L-amino-acid hydrolase